MSNKIGTATNKRIINIYNMMKENELIIKPSFQRNLVWNDTHKENFLETILKGLPFPEVYFADGEMDLEKKKSTVLVVDGQQRLSTIYDYINNSENLKLKSIKRFSELTPEEKTNFLDYNIVVRDLEKIEIEKIRDIFNRINSVQYALNAMEINNALYEGEYISTAKEILHESKLPKLEVFSENQYTRMEDLQFILLVMTTVEAGGYFAQNKEIESYIKRFNNEYPMKDSTKKDIISAIDLVVDLKLKPDSIWLRKSSLFTLIVELINFCRQEGHMLDESLLRDKLEYLESEIDKNKREDKETNVFAKFYDYLYQGTAYKKARVVRGEILRKLLYE